MGERRPGKSHRAIPLLPSELKILRYYMHYIDALPKLGRRAPVMSRSCRLRVFLLPRRRRRRRTWAVTAVIVVDSLHEDYEAKRTAVMITSVQIQIQIQIPCTRKKLKPQQS